MFFRRNFNIIECLAVSLVTFFALVMIAGTAHSAQTITTVKVDKAPTIDGSGDDAAWNSAQAFTVRDQSEDADITLKTVYTADEVFFLIRFPDAREDRYHKPWVWNKNLEVYEMGPQREDTFALKWNMMDEEVDLSNFSDDDYTADIWYWKAARSGPTGYADDKSHILASAPGKKATELTSKSGKKRYLMRLGDAGTSADDKHVVTDYEGDLVAQTVNRQPDGSRADIRAKGVWKDGSWTVEFGRKLNTGHDDDVQFDPEAGKKYQLGVSIYGLYGEPVDKSKEYRYGQGRISETLYFVFKK